MARKWRVNLQQPTGQVCTSREGESVPVQPGRRLDLGSVAKTHATFCRMADMWRIAFAQDAAGYATSGKNGQRACS